MLNFTRKEEKSMTDKERDELLINMANDMKNVKNDMKERDVILQKLSDDMKERDVILQKLSDDMKERDVILQKLSNGMNNMKNEMKEIKEEQRNLSRTVAKIEVEHGEKLQILLDVVTGQEEKNKEFERRFEEDERILDRHSDEIYYLKLKENKIKPIL